MGSNESPEPDNDNIDRKETASLLKELGLTVEEASSLMNTGDTSKQQSTITMDEALSSSSSSSTSTLKMNTGVAIGAGVFFLANVALLLSLPPVLRGRGAPYLPTFAKNMDIMFQLLRQEPAFQARIRAGEALNFIDLGSGDGRIVFRAARENMFRQSTGVEINPLLHVAALAQRLVWGYHSTTTFQLQDIWKTSLHSTHVVAVYGLGPIMDRLGSKLQDERESLVLASGCTTTISATSRNTFHGVLVRLTRSF